MFTIEQIKAMTVKEVVNNIANKHLKVKDIAEVLGKSEKTVAKKIKSLGYEWNFVKVAYEPVASLHKAQNDSKVFVDLFVQSPFAKAQKASQKVAEDRNKSINSVDKQGSDAIDTILFGKSTSRVQRAYYIDKDLAEIIDRVDGKQKSNLINECIRKVFQEKGIL